MTHEEDLSGVRARGQVSRELLSLRFVVGEADFDQTVVGQSLIEGGEEGLAHAIVSDMNDGLELLGAGFQFAQCRSGDAQAKNGLLAFSWATVVRGPWPGQMMVSPGRLRISLRILSSVSA